METANVSHFLICLGRLSVEAGVLVMLVLAAQGIFRKQLTPRWRCALWLLVVARLLLPLSITSVTSVFNLIPHWNEPVSSKPGLNEPTLPISSVSLNYPASPVPPAFGGEKPVLTPPPAPARMNVPAPVSFPAAIPSNCWSWPVCLFVAWLAGVILLAGHIVVSSVRLSRRCAKMRPLEDSAALAILDECRSRLNLRVKLALVEGGEVANPALFGFLRPRLLLPAGFTDKFSPMELRFVFLHELAHLKRRDLLMNWIMVIPQVLHWFNPLVWFGFARWRADRELACDAMALEAAGGDQNHEYGRTILRLLENFTRPLSAPGLVGILEDKRQLHRRIRMIASYVPTRGWPRLALVLIVLLAVIGLTDAQSRKPVPNEVPTHAPPLATVNASLVQTTTSQPRPVVTNGPSLKVTVLDARTGAPLSDAEVLTENGATYSGFQENAPRWKTASNGAAVVRLGEIPDDHLRQLSYFTLSARHEGFSPRGLIWFADDKDVRPAMPAEVSIRLEPGVTAGGFARDEAGAPLAGAAVRLYGTDHRGREDHEYSEFWSDSVEAPAILTDSSGHWQVRDFPRYLRSARVEFTCPDGSTQRFVQAGETDPRELGDPFSLADLKANKALFVIKRGTDLHGVVVDPEGQPLPGVLVRTGYGIFNEVKVREIRTDAAGRFELLNCSRQQIVFTAYPEHYSITSLIVDARTNTSEARLRVEPLSPLRIHVLDGNGLAVAGARATVYPIHTEGQMLEFEGTSDSRGTLVWSNAPVSEFTLRAALPNSKLFQDIRVTPDKREVTFHLRAGMDREILVKGSVHDAKTGQPVALQWVSYQTSNREGFIAKGAFTNSEFQIAIPDSRFRVGGMLPEYQIKLEAWGYGTLITPWRDFSEGDWNPSLALEPESVSRRTVLLPDGQPAAGAIVRFQSGGGFGPLTFTFASPGSFFSGHNFQVEADAAGAVELPNLPEDQSVTVTHERGFLGISFAELKRNQLIHLQPWASVSGVLTVDGKPLTNETVHIKSPMSGYGVNGYFLAFTSVTDSRGAFAFTNLPPGDYVLSRTPRGTKYAGLIESHRLPFDLRAGEIKHLDYGFGGHKIIGRVEPSSPVDWGNDPQELALKVSPAPPIPVSAAYSGNQEFQKAYDAYWRSPELRDYNHKQQHFLLAFDADGNFQADDVPPGTYELRLRITKPQTNDASRMEAHFLGREEELGSLVREIQVPAGTGALDLGTVKIDVKRSAQNRPPAPNEPKSASARPGDVLPFQTVSAPPLRVITNGPAIKVTILDEKTGEPIPDAEVLTDAFIGIPGLSIFNRRWLADRTGVAVIPLDEPPGERATRWITITATHKGHSPHGAFWVNKKSDARTKTPAEVTIRMSAGVTAGGTVRDEYGVPLAGVLVKIDGSDNPLRVRNLLPGEAVGAAIQRIEDGRDHQFASFWIDPDDAIALKTDAAGHWQINNFPADLHFVDVTLTRPDGTYKNFIQRGGVFRREGPGSVDLEDLKANRAELVLEEGIDVRGVVLHQGRPVPGAMVSLYNGVDKIGLNIPTRMGGVQADSDGRFVMRHCVPGLTKFSAQSNHFSAGQTEVDVETDMPEVRLRVGPRQLPTIGPLAVP